MFKTKITSIEEAIAFNPPDHAEFIKNFKSVFAGTASEKNLAYPGGWFIGMDSTEKQFSSFGKFYLDVAFNLLQQLETSNWDHRADGWILPILFLIVHGIEVYLKAIRSGLYTALGDDEHAKKITENSHDIKTICNICKKLIQVYKKNISDETAKDVVQAINVVDIFVHSVYDKTTDMTFARYPVKSKNLGDQFYVQNEAETINFARLKHQLLVVFDALDFICDELEAYIDFGDMGLV